MLTWVAQIIYTLKTWVENVVHWVVERVQDGWNYITRQVAETIKEWVEQTTWVKEWVEKEITVWDIVWETVPLPLADVLKNPLVISRLGLTAAVLTVLTALVVKCATPIPPVPTPDAVATQIACVRTQAAATAYAGGTQTAVARFTPTPAPTPIPTLTPYTVIVKPGDTLSKFAAIFGIDEADLMKANHMTDSNLQAGQSLIIPINTDHLSGILADVLRNERPTDVSSQEAWGAFNVLTNGEAYPNGWWMKDGTLTPEEMLALVMNGETAGNQQGYKAVVGRYVYYCGMTPDCGGNTANLLTFLSYYQAWRQSGYNGIFAKENPQSEQIAGALVNGDTAKLQQAGLSASLDPGNPDLPFHNANVTGDWNKILIRKLGRQPDGDRNFWVLSINDLKKVCGPDYGVLSPDMTGKENIPLTCQ